MASSCSPAIDESVAVAPSDVPLHVAGIGVGDGVLVGTRVGTKDGVAVGKLVGTAVGVASDWPQANSTSKTIYTKV